MIRMYTTVWCPDCHAAKRFLKERGIEFQEINIEEDPGAVDFVVQANAGRRSVPTFEIDGRTFSCSPFNARKLKENLGIQA
ncbi:MAG TPA: glutaredoxin family protein [Acidobacteriota bacterium]